jgi:hypothetical protein
MDLVRGLDRGVYFDGGGLVNDKLIALLLYAVMCLSGAGIFFIGIWTGSGEDKIVGLLILILAEMSSATHRGVR